MENKSPVSSNNCDLLESMKLLIPAYFYPGPEWDRLIDKVKIMPGQIYVIANVENGPGKKINTDYENTINIFRKKGGRVIGYVYTQYGSRSLGKVKKDIKKWYSYFNIDGIFFDEQSYIPGHERYYQNLYENVKEYNSEALIIGNPGTDTIETYIYYKTKRVTDAVCLFENETDLLAWKPASWVKKYSSNDFAVLTYNTDRTIFRQYVDHAKSKNAGWLYLTDAAMPNPWDRLASYFEEMCDYVRGK